VVSASLVTGGTIYHESHELSRTKKLPNVNVSSFLRNTLQIMPIGFARVLFPWTAAAVTKNYSEEKKLSNTERVLLSIPMGITAGLISNPLDLWLTQVYGSSKSAGVVFFEHLDAKGLPGFLVGGSMRSAQMVLWVMSSALAFEASRVIRTPKTPTTLVEMADIKKVEQGRRI
jgi:hypothetical protein